jgi:hypothetical protein
LGTNLQPVLRFFTKIIPIGEVRPKKWYTFCKVCDILSGGYVPKGLDGTTTPAAAEKTQRFEKIVCTRIFRRNGESGPVPGGLLVL